MKKTALITGASSGFGYEFAKIFAANGYDLVLTARNQEKLKALAAELKEKNGAEVFVIVKDLSQKDAALDIFTETEQAGIDVTVLVNNAGFGDYGRYADTDWEKQLKMVTVNIVALMQLTRLYLPQMRRRNNGKILNVASMAAFTPGPYMSVYYASKAFVLSFSEALTGELKGTGVTVTAVCPGPAATGFEKVAGSGARKLFGALTPASAKETALFSYGALTRGKIVAVPGAMNKISSIGHRFLPRSVLRAIILRLQGED
ncbi:MAG: SDR family oxidoreductase [Methanosarcinales archaeon]|jgi:short-subunit dehydrogenase|nr:SDR family oxidoreductase [Methanosarcinales archaeon]